ncbi:MAG TPA: hypothetical protein IGS17_08250 [Oscillatoriales cyanobacterium M59_W2019_021]|nr:MAG: hypothetical protein D6728_03090 [Cyanobacteria bacterium J055]HIK33981.1 hypothetical protein [Oscillatoriales cyanobacterium M4454_W2019_049]HIK50898.1 hypothetical protein [Oscillatoriales cyanobacterium M59_W2019_021]
MNGDEINEAIKTFSVTLANPANGEVLVTETATAAILNDDATMAIAAVNSRQPEGNAEVTPYTFTITRGGDVNSATTVNYAVSGRGLNPADEADFGGQFPSGVVEFAAGETLKSDQPESIQIDRLLLKSVTTEN